MTTADAELPVAAAARPRFARSLATTYAATLLAAALSLINVLVTARLLGPAGRGQIALATTIGTTTSTLALLGVEQATVNLAGREPARRAALATNALLSALVIGAVTGGALAGLVAFVPGVAGDLSGLVVGLALASIPLIIGRTYMQSLLEADYRFAWSNGVRVVSPLVGVLLNCGLGVVGLLSVGTAVAAWAGGQGLGMLIVIWFVARRGAGFGRPDAALVRQVLGFGLKSHLGRIMNLGNYRLDQWLVGALVGSRELGRYSVAVSISEILFFLPTSLASVQRPDLVRATRAGAAERAGRVFRAAVVVTLIVAAALIVAAPVLCVAVFGPGFAGSVDDLRVLCLGAVGVVAIKLLGDALTAQRRPLLSTAATAVGLAFTIGLDLLLIPQHGGLDLLLIPQHGGLGAGVASTIAYTAGGAAAGLLFVRALGARGDDLRPRTADLRHLLHQADGLRAALRSRW